jgi:ankyrin repeat protein
MPKALLVAGRVGPLDEAFGELHSAVKATLRPGPAIHNSSRSSELACRGGKERFFPRPPEALGHQASAVRADVPRKDLFGRTALLCCCEVDGDDRKGALLNSPIEKQPAPTGGRSRSVHESNLPKGTSYAAAQIPSQFITWRERKTIGERLYFHLEAISKTPSLAS